MKTIKPLKIHLWSSILPWSHISNYHEGVVVHKEGTIHRTFVFRGPDLASSSGVYVDDIARHLSDAIKRLGARWGIQFEVQRYCTQEYPGGQFSHRAPYLIDKEREAQFRSYGKHYAASYYLTFTYHPIHVIAKKLINFFYTETGYDSSMKESIASFVQQSDDIINILATKLYIGALDNEQTVQFLHSSLSTNRHYMQFPSDPFFLDRILPDQTLDTGLTMKLGDEYIPIVGVCDFPSESWPAMFDRMNALGIEYRWVSRYICVDKEEALKIVDKTQKAHRGNQVSWMQSFFHAASKEPITHINEGARAKELDASQAQVDIDTDAVGMGLYCANVMVWDKDLAAAQKKAAIIKQAIQPTGFTCKDETFNALEAFKSMMPGNMYANHRAFPIFTSTFSHLIPLSSIWEGMTNNMHAGIVSGCDTPLLVGSTDHKTPFFFNSHVGDVGHMTVWGPTGAGKTTFLNLLAMQFMKYPKSQVIIFDKDRGARQTTMAIGGRYYEPGKSLSSFQPLRDIDSADDRMWAVDFVETLFELQGLTVTPKMSTAVVDAIELLSGVPQAQRTLTTLRQGLNFADPQTGEPVLQNALSPYCLGGKHGAIFDGAADDFPTDGRWLTFEMDNLMSKGDGCLVPALLYLFHRVEKKFTGVFTSLTLDEAWLFLRHPRFSERLEAWLKTLRKKNVSVIFATQDVADAAKSPLCSTLVQQCLTKVFLADPMADTSAMVGVYRFFGLTDSEIETISAATMKRDYFYKSPLGCRLFKLDLGPITKGIIADPDQELLDRLAQEHRDDPEYVYVNDILTAKGIAFSHLMPTSS